MTSTRSRALGTIVTALMGLVLLPQAGHATTVGTPPPTTVVPVNTSAGDQDDPHVSGDWVVYSDFSAGSASGHVRYHNVATGFDAQVPGTDGASDSLADISATTAVFIRFSGGAHAVYTYDVATGAPPVELDPQPGSNRREAGVGAHTVAWQDFGFSTSGPPEIVVYDLDTHVATRLTTDELYDRDPQVSADGNTITWAKCTSLAGGCEIWDAVRTGTGWATAQLTPSGTESSLPDTNGAVVVAGRALGFDDADIVWQPASSGPEHELSLPSLQQNPSISGDVVVFESYDPSAATPNFDLYAYDLPNDRLYQLTDTPEDETLNDVSVAADRTVTMAWTRHEATGDDNVYAERFMLPATTSNTVAAIEAPVQADGSSTFKANRGVIPIKFTLTVDSQATCDLPSAQINVARVSASSSETVDETVYNNPADSGSTFRVSGCEYTYNLAARDLGVGNYAVTILINGQPVGTAGFALR